LFLFSHGCRHPYVLSTSIKRTSEREGKRTSTVQTRRAQKEDQGKNERKTEEKKMVSVGQPSIIVIFIFKCRNSLEDLLRDNTPTSS
jgi:hypothetical protein